ncbi:hypothetical protein BKA65DRAFT_509517 [Rhexocercosporidium sp. MPI-PUGE-AT-0058]|nr:hypothetical protein BKA65DRAFT_509517 [Rhexocercosporidium sp. MPI-PUGE-AT-0058]
MDLIQSASSALSRCFTSSRRPHDTLPVRPPLKSFPQFSELPTELRLRIWSVAAPSRIVRVHLHEFSPPRLRDEQRWEGYAPDSDSNSSADVPSHHGPRFIQGPAERRPDLPMYGVPRAEPHHMLITLCSASHPCGCDIYPPRSQNLLPIPGVLLACHESRGVLLGQYRRCLEEEYDTWGNKVVNPISRMQKSLPSQPPVTGVIMNPSADILHVGTNVASCHSVVELNRFAGIVAQQIPDVRKIVLNLHIAMPPYKFWASGRFQYWKNWGGTGWWVPARHLVNMPCLKEVVLVVNKSERMLPVEWRNRTESQWIEELLKVEDQWPAVWEGKIPSLKFVQSVEDVWMPSW